MEQLVSNNQTPSFQFSQPIPVENQTENGMNRRNKSIFLIIGFVVMVLFILVTCYLIQLGGETTSQDQEPTLSSQSSNINTPTSVSSNPTSTITDAPISVATHLRPTTTSSSDNLIPFQSIPYPLNWPSELFFPDEFILLDGSFSQTSENNSIVYSADFLFNGDAKNAADLIETYFINNSWSTVERSDYDSFYAVLTFSRNNEDGEAIIFIGPAVENENSISAISTTIIP